MLKFVCFILAVTVLGKTKAGHFPQENVRSFTVDYERNTFLKDGKPYRYIAGSFHYFRVPHEYWEDRIAKMAAAGLDAIQTYVAWNIHEPHEGVFDFEGQNDLIKFIQIAQKHNLYIILRPGPYICAEWEYGGFPAWFLSTNETVVIRQMDYRYIRAVRRWFGELLSRVKPHLYANGGPILMVQVENEYGSFKCDHDYMDHLAEFMEDRLGSETVLFTTDGNGMNMLKCGTTKRAFATVDFGITRNASGSFQPMRDFNNNKGPLVNSEFYTGWLDSWGDHHHRVSIGGIIGTLAQMEALNASYSMYMFLGGTSFGYMNGANYPRYQQPTSYDYNAPLNEAGDITDKYLAIRNFISKSKPDLPPVPKNSEKRAYGDITLKRIGNILELLDVASTRSVKTEHPIPMEHINHYYGFILYSHVIKRDSANSLLNVPGLRDRGHVLLDGQSVGVLQNTLTKSLILSAKKGQRLDILVENMGRYNYGGALSSNSKGIIDTVSLGDNNLTDWTMHPIDLDNFFKKDVASTLRIDSLKFRSRSPLSSKVPLLEAPSVYMGTFRTPEHEVTKDTFLDMCGWTWGVVYVNGHNLGRFRPKLGPQITLYVPAVYLKPYPEKNVVMVFEMENVQPTGPAMAKVVSRDKPELDSTCFQYDSK